MDGFRWRVPNIFVNLTSWYVRKWTVQSIYFRCVVRLCTSGVGVIFRKRVKDIRISDVISTNFLLSFNPVGKNDKNYILWVSLIRLHLWKYIRVKMYIYPSRYCLIQTFIILSKGVKHGTFSVFFKVFCECHTICIIYLIHKVIMTTATIMKMTRITATVIPIINPWSLPLSSENQ